MLPYMMGPFPDLPHYTPSSGPGAEKQTLPHRLDISNLQQLELQGPVRGA